jgi:DNA-binding LytR/AlgR family response regulator
LIAHRKENDNISKGLQESIFIKDDKKHHQVHLSDLQYIKANGNYTSVYLTGSQLLSQMKISDFENLLPAEHFSRVHRSYIVAHHALTLIKASEVRIDDAIIPVGRVYKARVSKLVK